MLMMLESLRSPGNNLKILFLLLLLLLWSLRMMREFLFESSCASVVTMSCSCDHLMCSDSIYCCFFCFFRSSFVVSPFVCCACHPSSTSSSSFSLFSATPSFTASGRSSPPPSVSLPSSSSSSSSSTKPHSVEAREAEVRLLPPLLKDQAWGVHAQEAFLLFCLALGEWCL